MLPHQFRSESVRRRHQRGRDVNGILLLDKPFGLTSNGALQDVKRLYQARKVGHTGSLDPLATGLLPLCFGEATKVSGFLLDADKRYRAEFQLGITTDSGDADGQVLEQRPVPSLEWGTVEGVLARFIGEIQQIPPMHSAIKVQGKPLYTLAHQGLTVEREARTVTIHAFTLLGMEANRLNVDIHCSKGTYVRTLAEDVGQILGCGAHVSALRRLAVGPFDDPMIMVDMEQLRDVAAEGDAALDGLLLPVDRALERWPAVNLTSDSAFYLGQGQPVLVPRAPTSGLVRLYGPQQRFIGVGEVLDDGRIAPRRLAATN